MENNKITKFVLAPKERKALLESKIARAQAQIDAVVAQIEAVKKMMALPQQNKN